MTRVDINQVSRQGNTGGSVSSVSVSPPSQFNNSDWYELGMQGRGRGVQRRVCGGGVAVYTTHSPPTLHNSDFH